MLKSVIGQRAGSAPLKKAKYAIDVYSIDEFIPSQLLDVYLPNKEGAKPVSAGHDPTAGVLRELSSIRSIEWTSLMPTLTWTTRTHHLCMLKHVCPNIIARANDQGNLDESSQKP
jgi:hypothetical protein